jgi:hypothetical protein
MPNYLTRKDAKVYYKIRCKLNGKFISTSYVRDKHIWEKNPTEVGLLTTKVRGNKRGLWYIKRGRAQNLVNRLHRYLPDAFEVVEFGRK